MCLCAGSPVPRVSSSWFSLPYPPSTQMSSRYREDGVGSRGEARNESVLGFLAKAEPVPSFSHWAWGHVGRMYSWIRIHTKDTTWKYPIGSRVAGSSWKIRRNERSLCDFGGLSRAVLLGTVKLRGRRVGRWQLLTFLAHSTIGNLDECCRPQKSRHAIPEGLQTPDIFGPQVNSC